MLEAIFTAGINEIKVIGLTQWDRGQKITVTCPDITELYQVHFAFKGGTEALVVNAANKVFEIPDELLMQPRDLIAYVYAISSNGSGETVKTIHLPVTPRAKPEDYTSELTPSQMEQLEAMLAEFYEDATAKAQNAVDTVKAHPNPNLLDNWYFGNPVNQRGQTEYADAGYSIDRWTAASAERVAIVSGGIQLRFSGSSRQFIQYIDNGAELFGKTVTLSVLSEAGLRAISIAIPQASSATTIGKGADVSSGVQVYLRYSGAALYVSFYSSSNYHTGTPVLIKAAKLELGTQQTLAHQDANGNWVLNEIPNYVEELAKCQRYYQLFASEAARPAALADYRPSMRVTPATGTININGATYYYADANL